MIVSFYTKLIPVSSDLKLGLNNYCLIACQYRQLLIYAEIDYQEVTRVIVQLISVSQSFQKEEASYYCVKR